MPAGASTRWVLEGGTCIVLNITFTASMSFLASSSAASASINADMTVSISFISFVVALGRLPDADELSLVGFTSSAASVIAVLGRLLDADVGVLCPAGLVTSGAMLHIIWNILFIFSF
ncbi:MAG: hypothetical protein LBU81_05550 [Methanosarcinales archaeon]|nr:hypothetical protein [Methanosarcinales archaeon]